jgi:Histidine kinase
VTPVREPVFDLWRSLAWGTTWAVTVSIVEALAISPLEAWGSREQLFFFLIYWTTPYWCGVGAVVVWLCARTARSGTLPGLIAGFIVLTIVSSAAWQPMSAVLIHLAEAALPSLERYAQGSSITRPTRENWLSIAFYMLWVNLFYGGLLVAVCRVTLRDERIRHRLHQAAMSRSRTQALLDAERLQALQAQIDPGLLLDSMQELKQRYRDNPQGAERLLEALVEFMRYAMHGLRHPISTLAAEVQLAAAFAQLQRERGVEGAWRVIEEPSVDPERSYKFPSLLMLPLLGLGGEDRRPVLTVRTNKDRGVLSLQGIGERISDELLQQMRSRFRALYGEGFAIETGSTLQSRLSITLHFSPLNPGESNDRSIGR